MAANRPVVAGAALLYPSRDVFSRTLQQDGIALVDIRAQLTALQANIIGRFLEPVRIAWNSSSAAGSPCLSQLESASACPLFLFSFFLLRKKPYMSVKVADRSNISGQLKETSGSKAYTARPTTGEAASPWQAMCV